MDNDSKSAILITGASTGIGEACALRMDSMGYRVFAGVRRQSDADALQKKASSRLTPIFLDVTDQGQIDAAVHQVSEAVGDIGLHGLVNNAGVAVSGPLEFLPLTEIRWQFEINLFGQIAVTQAFFALLRKAAGRIVNMSSISGRVTFPFFGPYSASKFALESFSDALRREVVPWGMTVSVIEPGSIATPIWDKSLEKSKERMSNFPPQAHALYGHAMQRTEARAMANGRRGVAPEVVAEVVAHALTAPRPKIRYTVGREARIAVLLSRYIPDWLMDKITYRATHS
ncbi:MAG: SDR family NAD(P)-dependent oxidoreductase [Anaerolineae bacterium]|nr:SDR family NAD(P)-dependent oxidoreductase [Anaerolineae bacterium]